MSYNTLNFFSLLTFSIDINDPPLRTQKVGFSALVQQGMFKGVAIYFYQVAYCIPIPEYVLLHCKCKKKKKKKKKK